MQNHIEPTNREMLGKTMSEKLENKTSVRECVAFIVYTDIQWSRIRMTRPKNKMYARRETLLVLH
jgi:hypothetical protein